VTGTRRLLAALAVLLLALPAAAQKTDKVHLLNGDHLTGDIKRMQQGKLELKTDDMQRVHIEWKKIAWVSSDNNFRVEAEDGEVFQGSLVQPNADRVLVVSGDELLELDMDEVAWIQEVNRNFWKRLTGFFSIGVSYIKSTDIGQFTWSFQAAYRESDNLYQLDGNSIVSSQRSEKSRVKADLAFVYRRSFGDRWFFQATTGTETDEILGIDQRTSLAAQMGRYVSQSYEHEFALSAGLRGNYEDGSELNQSSAEGAVTARYQIFRYSPDLTLYSELTAFPSLTISDRIRVDFDTRFRWELVKDLFWEFRYYTNYDSDPPSLSGENTDYGIISSMGYSF